MVLSTWCDFQNSVTDFFEVTAKPAVHTIWFSIYSSILVEFSSLMQVYIVLRFGVCTYQGHIL